VKDVIVLALTLTLFSTTAFAKDQGRMVPITTSPDGLLLVSDSLGPGVNAHFVLDTGAGVTVLAPSLIEKVKGKPAGRFTGFRMTGDRIDLALYSIPELRVGSLCREICNRGSLGFARQVPPRRHYLGKLVSQPAIHHRLRSKAIVP